MGKVTELKTKARGKPGLMCYATKIDSTGRVGSEALKEIAEINRLIDEYVSIHKKISFFVKQLGRMVKGQNRIRGVTRARMLQELTEAAQKRRKTVGPLYQDRPQEWHGHIDHVEQIARARSRACGGVCAEWHCCGDLLMELERFICPNVALYLTPTEKGELYLAYNDEAVFRMDEPFTWTSWLKAHKTRETA